MIAEVMATLVLAATGCGEFDKAEAGISCVPVDQDVAYIMPRQFFEDFHHEEFHVIDHHLTDEWRGRWLDIMDEDRAWRTAPNSPHEQAAEGYADCANGRGYRLASDDWAYGFSPTRKQYRDLCGLYRAINVKVRWQLR